MIKINRNATQPPSLAANATSWKAEVLAHIANGEDIPKSLKNKYNQSDVKSAIKLDAKGKCMYCESKPLGTGFGEIEHIKPKKTYRDLIFEWVNLGLACQKCNNNKRDTYDTACPPIDPYTEDPSDHLIPLGPIILAKPGDDRGTHTLDLLDLNRPELVEKRNRKVIEINNFIQMIAKLPDTAKKTAMARQLKVYIDENAEFAFIARDVMQKLESLL